MHRATPLNSSFRSYVAGGARSVIDKIDDSKLMQEMAGNFMCAANTPFAGLLKLNGALLVRAEHPLLWTFANASGRIVNEVDWQTPASRLWSSFSRGDGVSTFRLPDFRAEFLRFWDDGRGVDASRILGQQQKDQVGEFTYSGTITSLNVQWLYFNETGPSSSGHSPTQPPNYWGYGCPIMVKL